MALQLDAARTEARMFELLSHVGIHNARELASYGANLLLCTVFVAALFQTFRPRDDEQR